MIGPFVKLALTTTVVSLFFSNPTTAQVFLREEGRARRITKGPVPELISDYVTFIRDHHQPWRVGRSLRPRALRTDPKT